MLPDMQCDYSDNQRFLDFFGRIAGKTKGIFKVTPLAITPIGDELVVTHSKRQHDSCSEEDCIRFRIRRDGISFSRSYELIGKGAGNNLWPDDLVQNRNQYEQNENP